MTNVIKHSQATTAEIELDFGPTTVVLRITDNGRGFDPNQCTGPNEGHFGLLGISERAKRLGAALTINSQPGTGTIVTVRVALEPEFRPDETIASPIPR